MSTDARTGTETGAETGMGGDGGTDRDPGGGASTRSGGEAGADRHFRVALRRLRTAQKTPKGVSLYSRYVNRPAGRVCAAAAHRVGLGPNQVTLLSAACSFTGVGLIALVRPSWALGLCVWLALAVGFALDSADGQLARLRGGGSVAGEWLDHVVDCAKIVALHAAVLISFYRFFALPGDGWLLLPLGFQVVAVLLFFGGLLTDQLRTPRHPAATATATATDTDTATATATDTATATATAAPHAPVSFRSVALLPVDHGVFCAVFLLLGGAGVFRAAYAALFACSALFAVAFLVRWFRELSADSARTAPG